MFRRWERDQCDAERSQVGSEGTALEAIEMAGSAKGVALRGPAAALVREHGLARSVGARLSLTCPDARYMQVAQEGVRTNCCRGADGIERTCRLELGETVGPLAQLQGGHALREREPTVLAS